MSKVSKNILYNLVGQTLIVALTFWGTRLVFRQLGDEVLGILYFAIATNNVLVQVLDLGISSTLIREVSRHIATDREYVIQLTRTSVLFYWFSYAGLGLVVWFTVPWVVHRWITLRTLDPTVAVHALRLLALSLLLMLPRSLYSNLLRGVERMEFNNIIDAGSTALRQGGTILIVTRGGGLVEIGYCYLVALVLSILAYLFIAVRFFPWRAFFPGFSREAVRRNVSFTSQMGAYSVLATIQMECDKVLVSRFMPVGLMGFYGVAQTMVTRVTMIPAAVIQAAFPNLSALFQSRDRTGLTREYRRLQDLVCYSLVPAFAAVIFAARPLYTFLFNAQSAQTLLLPTSLLCLGFYMNGTLNVPAILSVAVDRPDISLRQLLYAFLFVPLVTGVLIWKWGLTGASLSFVLYYLYAYSYGGRRWASECIGMAPRDWYMHVLKIFALALLTYGAAWLILVLMGQTSITALAAAYALASAVYLYAAYLAMGNELREGLIGWQGRMTGRVLRYTSPNS
ncbi:MAG TPA: oligosaccharide flippase family protein [Candidatus Eremiobacteraceae bacterium]|nr:oligosaccharide flippase family protein [Candidatus Eremiobacteraceae bacterium]